MISIIVPVYNIELYLPRCIESIQQQTLKSLEIILVDDGSTDLSGEICDKYASQDKRIKVIHQKNCGQVAARNAGIKIATGEYIGFVDGDDWIEEDMFAVMYESMRVNDADIVMEGMVEEASGRQYYCKNVLPVGVYKTLEQRVYLYQNMMNCEQYFKLGIQPYLWNKLFRKEIVEKNMPFIDNRIKVGEDAAAVFAMLQASKCVVILPDCHYHYCIRSTSVMMKGVTYQEERESAKACYQYLIHKFDQSKYNQSIKCFCINLLLTRMYEQFVYLKHNSILFPFENVNITDSIIIYGAGALGKAVYKYVTSNPEFELKGWTDSNAEKYQKQGLAVLDIKDIPISMEDKIVVAVFSGSAFGEIKKTLINRGIEDVHILGVMIKKQEELKMLKWMEEDK